MSGSCTLDAETSWVIHARETWAARQKILADSINDTARMARTTLSLVLLVALYLCLTLLVSTDEQLLLDSRVALPQVDIGVSIKTSYILAPPIFLYLHIQAVFLLSVLVQKMRVFMDNILGRNPRNARIAGIRRQNEADPREQWHWLSAFVFVQLYRTNGNFRYCLSLILSFISIALIPVLLLFIIDISFVRYQSAYITYFHHAILLLDLVLVFCACFAFYACFIDVHLSNASSVDKKRIWYVVVAKRIWYYVAEPALVILLLALMMWILIFGIWIHPPPHVDDWETTNGGTNIWRTSDGGGFSDEMMNPIDSYLCKWRWWPICRYIDVNGKFLTNIRIIDVPVSVPGKSDDQYVETKKTFARELILKGRTLRFACFRGAWLHYADLESSDLRGADFGSAILDGTNFSNAELHDTNFTDAELNDTDWGGVALHRSNLSGAKLRNADLGGAELHGANLSNDQDKDAAVSGTEKCVRLGRKSDEQDSDAIVPDADPGNATILHGADLRFARLYGADLRKAELHGADLRGAELYGADLRGAELYGANLEGVKLDGVDLGNAKLVGSFGEPESLQFLWMPDTSFSITLRDRIALIDKIAKHLQKAEASKIEIKWNGNISLEKYLRESIRNNIYPRITEGWPPSVEISAPEYWRARSKWAADFACKNKYTARSILKRWTSDTPLSGMSLDIPDMAGILSMARSVIRNALERARKNPKCLGLRAVSDDEWQKEWQKIATPASSVSACAPPVQACGASVAG